MRLPRREEIEEFEYEPTSVKDLLTEMKDVSELIVDLAYSAVLLDSEDIATEVQHLEARMDTLNYRIRLTAMLAARSPEDAEQLSGILQVAGAAEDISNAAGDIVKLLADVETRPYLPRLLERAEERLKAFQLPGETPLDGHTLEGLELGTETGMRVIAIRRGRKWIYGPAGDATLKGGDVLVLRGTDEGFEVMKQMAEGA